MMYGQRSWKFIQIMSLFLWCTHWLDEHQVGEHEHVDISHNAIVSMMTHRLNEYQVGEPEHVAYPLKAWSSNCRVFYSYALHY